MADLKRMGREWAELAIRHSTEPTTTGNLEHDRSCAERYLRHTGKPPQWYSREHYGPIYLAGGVRPWTPDGPNVQHQGATA